MKDQYGVEYSDDKKTLIRCPKYFLGEYQVSEGVEIIREQAFSECGYLISIDIPDSVQSIGSFAFKNCKSLSRVKLPNNLQEIKEGTFYGCSQLKDWNIVPKSIKQIGKRAFAGCNFTEIDLFCSALDGAFDGCPLLYVNINNGVDFFDFTTENWHDEDYACIFRNTYFIFLSDVFFTYRNESQEFGSTTPEWKSVSDEIKAFNIDGIESDYASGAYSTNYHLSCYGVVEPAFHIRISNGVVNLYRFKDEIMEWGAIQFNQDEFLLHCQLFNKRPLKVSYNDFDSNASQLKYCNFKGSLNERKICIPEGVEEIEEFDDIEYVDEIWLPSSLKTINKGTFNSTNLNQKFFELKFPNGNNIENIGDSAFVGFEFQSGEDLSTWKELKSIGESAFEGSNLSQLDLSKTEIEVINKNAFANCKDLEKVILPDGLKVIEAEAFCGCSSLTSINIPDSVERIGDFAFKDCSSLTSINIPNSVERIEDYVFENCSNLSSIRIPKSIKHIGESAFESCDSLPIVENIRYAGTCLVAVTDDELASYYIQLSTTYIAERAFSYCEKLTSIHIPNNVKRIGEDAFTGCSNLQSITLSKSIKGIEKNVFDDCPNLNTIYVSKGEKKRFAEMDGLKGFADKIIEQ